jgi:protein arginine N-methyltransferase 1
VLLKPATIQDHSIMLSRLASDAVDPLVSLMYRLKRNPRLRKFIIDARNRNIFVTLDQHERMLSDQLRVDTYYRAISKQVKKGDIVVDLGTGTGILSFFAAAQDTNKIYAIDHSNIIETAKAVAKRNGIRSIEFLKTSSMNFAPTERPNVLIHEQMGQNLFAEGIVRNICDLRDRVLTQDCRIIPGRFSLFMEPVRLKNAHRIPHVSELNLHGVRFDCLREGTTEENSLRALHSHQVDALLCNPEPVLELDFRSLDPSTLPDRLCVRKRVTTPGRMDGVCVYWTAHFDDELELSTSPLAPHNHWGSWFMRGETQEYDAGTVLEFTWTIGELTEISSWRYTLRTEAVG